MDAPEAIAPATPATAAERALLLKTRNRGCAVTASMPRIKMTAISSIRVKPAARFIKADSPFPLVHDALSRLRAVPSTFELALPGSGFVEVFSPQFQGIMRATYAAVVPPTVDTTVHALEVPVTAPSVIV